MPGVVAGSGGITSELYSVRIWTKEPAYASDALMEGLCAREFDNVSKRGGLRRPGTGCTVGVACPDVVGDTIDVSVPMERMVAPELTARGEVALLLLFRGISRGGRFG